VVGRAFTVEDNVAIALADVSRLAARIGLPLNAVADSVPAH